MILMTFAIRPQVDIAHLDEVSLYMTRNEEVPSELIAKCRRMGEGLTKTDDAPWGWTTLVACAAAAWDEKEALRLADMAIAAEGENALLLCNLAISFKHICRPDVAARYSAGAHRVAPLDADVLLCYLDDLFMLGEFSKAVGIVAEAERVRGSTEDVESLRRMASSIVRVASDLELSGVQEKRVQAELSMALQVMAETRNRYDGIHFVCQKDPEDGGCSMQVSIEFFGTLEDELRLGDFLAPRLADMVHWDPSSLNTSFAYQLREQHADVSV